MTDKQITEIAGMVAENNELRKALIDLVDENTRLRWALVAVRSGMFIAPLSDTWWYSDTETMLDMIDYTLKDGGE